MKTLSKAEIKKVKGGCPPDPRCPDIWDYCECMRAYSIVQPDCSSAF